MAGTKITDLPVSNTAENANLIANVNGQATQIPASTVGAQPDWNETDETKPSFILNKPETSGYIHYSISQQGSDGDTMLFILMKDGNSSQHWVQNIYQFISDFQKAPIFFDDIGGHYGHKGSPCLGFISAESSGKYPIVYALSANSPITPYTLRYNRNGGDIL